MKNTMYYKLLKTLNKVEFYEFEYFLKYILKARPKCLLLYSTIKNNYKNTENWNEFDLTMNQLYFELYKKEMPANTSVLRELGSELLNYLKHYCAYLQFKKNESEYYFKYLYENEINSLFENEYRKNHLTNTQIHGTELFWKDFEFMELYVRKQIKKVVPNIINFNQYFKFFTQLTTLKKFQIQCIIEQNALVKKSKIDEEIKTAFEEMNNIHKSNQESSLLHNLYYQSIIMLQKKSDNYEKFKNKVYKNRKKIAKYDMYILVSSLVAFCNLQIQNASASISNYFKEEQQFHYFFLYEEGLLNDGKYVMAMHVKNICLLAILRTKNSGRLKLSLQKAKQIIEDSKQKITPQYAESTYHFNMAVLNFYTKNYQETIKLFSHKNQYVNYYFTCDSNLYLLKCYYLTDDNYNFEKKVAAFRESLRRDKYLSNQEKDSYKNAIKALVRLKKIKGQKSYKYRYNPQKDLNKLKEIITNNAIQSIDWFMEQLEALVK